MSTIHSILNRIDLDSLDLEFVIEESIRLYDGFPPKLLITRGPKRNSISCLFSKYFTKSKNIKKGIELSKRNWDLRKRNVTPIHFGIFIGVTVLAYTFLQYN